MPSSKRSHEASEPAPAKKVKKLDKNKLKLKTEAEQAAEEKVSCTTQYYRLDSLGTGKNDDDPKKQKAVFKNYARQGLLCQDPTPTKHAR